MERMTSEIQRSLDRPDRPVRFCFVVHALSRLHRGVMAVPSARWGLISQMRDGTAAEDVLRVCRMSLDGHADGVVVGVPMIPHDLLVDQERAVERMVQAVDLAGPVDAVGLGSLCAVVGGRGEELAHRLSTPVTNGGAATAWAMIENIRSVLAQRSGVRVAVLGARGPVGRVVAEQLAADGVEVCVDHPRAAKGIEVRAAKTPADAVVGCGIVVGAGPTGGTLPAKALEPGTVMIDVAIPGTVVGRPDPSVTILAGEAVSFPAHWKRNFWSHLYHLLSGYGPSQVFACLLEPLVLAHLGRTTPFSIGRHIQMSDVTAFGDAALQLGFRPRLSVGWSAFPVERLQIVG